MAEVTSRTDSIANSDFSYETLDSWKEKLDGKRVMFIINGKLVVGDVKSVMTSGGFPKRLIAIVLDTNNVNRTVYDLNGIEVLPDLIEEP